MDFFKNWIYPLRKVFSNYSRDFMPQRTNTIDFDELQKLPWAYDLGLDKSLLTISSIYSLASHKDESIGDISLLQPQIGRGDSYLGAGAVRKLYRSKSS